MPWGSRWRTGRAARLPAWTRRPASRRVGRSARGRRPHRWSRGPRPPGATRTHRPPRWRARRARRPRHRASCRPPQLVASPAEGEGATVGVLVVLAERQELERGRPAEPRLEGPIPDRAVRHVARPDAERGGVDNALAAVVEDGV